MRRNNLRTRKEGVGMIELLTVCNTVMTLGILIGVWWGVFKTDGELKEAIFKLNRFLKAKIDDLTDGDD